MKTLVLPIFQRFLPHIKIMPFELCCQEFGIAPFLENGERKESAENKYHTSIWNEFWTFS